MAEENGSQGRFLRIESKLDSLVDDFGDFRVEVTEKLTRLETKAGVQTERVTVGQYQWMRVGIVASFVIGLTSVIVRVVWG